MEHIQSHFLGQSFHADSIYFAWACMALILACAVFLVAGLKVNINEYGNRQFFAEGIFSFVRSLTSGQIGKRGDSFVFFIGSIFLFILVNYYAGLLPWKMGAIFSWWPQMPVHEVAEHGHHAVEHISHPWHGASPCADINITAGMAVIVIIAYFFTGVFVAGFKYVELFLPFAPSKKGWAKLNPMCILEVMDLAIRPLTLSLRLFANTFAGETLLATAIAACAWFLPAGVLGFEIAVGLLQAFLFTILSTVYIGAAVQHAEHLLHDEHH